MTAELHTIVYPVTDLVKTKTPPPSPLHAEPSRTARP